MGKINLFPTSMLAGDWCAGISKAMTDQPPSPSAAALWERLKKDYSVGCAGAFNVLVIRDIEAFAAQAVAAAESESQKHIVAADCRRIWFHGTGSEEAARSILETGFRSNTHFARAMEDAVEFGGPHIFDVLLDVDCDQWQLLLADPVPAVRIARYRIVSTETKFEGVERREAFFGTSYMGSYAEPKPYPACPYEAAERAKPAASDREAALRLKAELPHISFSHEWLAKVAAALSERGERERQFWTDLISAHLNGRNLNVSAFLSAAAIHNQTLTGDQTDDHLLCWSWGSSSSSRRSHELYNNSNHCIEAAMNALRQSTPGIMNDRDALVRLLSPKSEVESLTVYNSEITGHSKGLTLPKEVRKEWRYGGNAYWLIGKLVGMGWKSQPMKDFP